MTISGTGEAGDTISVVADDGDIETEPQTTTVDENGDWTITIDVSALQDGTITFTVTATDAAQNSTTDSITAEKDTVTFVTISEITDPIGIGNQDNTGIAGTAFCTRLVTEKGVALVPGAAFGDDRWVRLSYAAATGEIAKALERIVGFARSL